MLNTAEHCVAIKVTVYNRIDTTAAFCISNIVIRIVKNVVRNVFHSISSSFYNYNRNNSAESNLRGKNLSPKIDPKRFTYGMECEELRYSAYSPVIAQISRIYV